MAVEKPAPTGAGEIMMAYKQVAATPEGRLVFEDLVRRFAYTRQSLISPDALQMAWREGQRTVLVHIGRMIDGDPAEFSQTYKREGEG